MPGPAEEYIAANPPVPWDDNAPVRAGQAVVLRLLASRGPVTGVVHLNRFPDGVPKEVATFDEVIDQFRERPVAELTNAEPGKYVLTWVLDGAAADWRVVSELVVGGGVRYRNLTAPRPNRLTSELVRITVIR